MSMLSDGTIKRHLRKCEWGSIEIDPWEEKLINPCSVDLRLGRELRDIEGELVAKLHPTHPYRLHPGEFLLGSTVERVRLASEVQGQVSGKSSLGRLGLQIHQTAGFIDPGFNGEITLELLNVSRRPIELNHGMRIAQIAFTWLDVQCERPYGHSSLESHYQGQVGATPSWMAT